MHEHNAPGFAKRQQQRKKLYLWIIIIVCIILVGAAVFLVVHFFLPKNIFSFKKTVVLPTAIDLNFLNQVNQCFLPVASLYGYTLRVTSGFRSVEEQELLYESGRTIDGHIITDAEPLSSIHNFGYAVDVVDRYRGYNIDWDKLIKIATYCGLESGGPGDLPHFEHRAGLTTADFRAGERPPPLKLPCPIMAERSPATTTPLSLADLKACNAPTF